MSKEKQIAVSLETIKNIDTINELLKKNLETTLPNEYEKPSDEELKRISNELVILIADGASQKNDTIQKAFEHHQKNYSEKRDLNQIAELTKAAYKFVNDNWDPIFATIWMLRELGYLKIENSAAFKSIFKKLQKKEKPTKKETSSDDNETMKQ